MSEDSPLAVSVEDKSDVAFVNRVSTLKLRVKNRSHRILRNIFLCPPPGHWEHGEVKGRYGDVQLMWGGGIRKGCLVMLPNDRTELHPGEEGIAYFLLYPGGRTCGEVDMPLDIYVGDDRVGSKTLKIKVLKGDIRAYVYRPRYVPIIDERVLPLVRRVIEEYGVPDVKTEIWPFDISVRAPGPRVEVYFEDRKIGMITGDVGSGFMHIAKIKVLRNVFVGEAPSPEGGRRWYWIVRVWLFWLDKSVFDEVPDEERVEFWVNPDTERVDWVLTDDHWKEVVYKGPVECVDVKITGGVHRTLRAKLIGLVRSYHPPSIRNMKKYLVSDDSRDPRRRALTLEHL